MTPSQVRELGRSIAKEVYDSGLTGSEALDAIDTAVQERVSSNDNPITIPFVVRYQSSQQVRDIARYTFLQMER